MKYKLTDNVIGRIAQIVQEGILLGVDIVDLMRQIELEVTPDGTQVELTVNYVQSVNDMHRKLLEEASILEKNRDKTKLIFNS